MIAFGCEDKNRSPIIEDRKIEVFLLGGRIMEDAVCECGYVIEAQEAILKVTDRKKES